MKGEYIGLREEGPVRKKRFGFLLREDKKGAILIYE